MVAQLKHRDVEGAAAEVVDRNPLPLVVGGAVGQCGRGRLVEHPLHIKPGELTGEHRALALCLVEVRGNRDDGTLDHFAQMLLGDGLHVPQHKRLNLLYRQLLVADHDLGGIVAAAHNLVAVPRRRDLYLRRVKGAPDEPLRRVDRVHGIDREPVLRRPAHKRAAIRKEGDHRGLRLPAFAVGDDHGLPVYHRCDAGIARA